MAFTNYIQQIKDTGGTTHDLVDTSASHYVKGTQTSSTNVWTGALPDGVTAYYDGLSIDYFLPYAGTSTAATLNLGSKGAKPVYVGNGTGGVTTHFPQYSVIHLTYIVNSSLNSGNGCWKATGYYNTNTTYSQANSNTTGISISDHGTTSITGVSGSVTASKVTLGTAFSIPNVTGNSNITVPIKNTSATNIPNVTGVGTVPSLSFAIDGTDSGQLNITWSAGSTPTLGTAISIIGVQSSTTTASKVTLGTAFSVPNVAGNSDVTVPKAASATTVVTGKTHSITDPGHMHTLS